MTPFQRDGSQFLKKNIPELYKIYISKKKTKKKNRERIYNCRFSKVNAGRKERSETYSPEDICLKFGQTQGNVKAVLVSKNINIQ